LAEGKEHFWGIYCPLKTISIAAVGWCCAVVYVTKKSIMLLVRLTAEGDRLARHTGCIADCGLATAIGIVGVCAQVQ